MTSAEEAHAHAAPPRFAEALHELGLGELLPRVRRFPEATRTAAEAAAAIGCDLSQICKSLIFTVYGSPRLRSAVDAPDAGVPVLVLMDGASRVDVERVRRELGAEKVTRAKADLVRETTGYAIGGVPPFGHRTRTRVLADRSLLAHDTVWAAAGSPYTVFPMAPDTLVVHAGGTLVDVRERPAGDGDGDGEDGQTGKQDSPESAR
ncbi:YbaK/EbsC family protein [Streptomyces sp. NPDC059786]|uniref:YbaK/EbsC family protein n=1 Tax=Streptomyces sp. NPDC059786 TaxID=3346946 RepID=UPI003661DDB0